MAESILIKGILFGILLSFIVGPVFFVLLETSIKKGIRHAIFLDIGVLFSDILYLIASFFFAQEINTSLNENNFVKYIAGGVFIVMGVVSILKSHLVNNNTTASMKSLDSGNSELPIIAFKKRTFIGLIAKGIGLNAINPGVLVYWIAACTYATEELEISNSNLIYYFGATLTTMFCVDLLKIYFASKLNKRLNNKNLRFISIIVGGALILFGLAICFKEINV